MARFDLRLTDAEYQRMTPRRLAALIKRKELETTRQDWRAAMIASIIANVNRDPRMRREPFTPDDFMPKFEPIRRQTTEEIADTLKTVVDICGVKRG